tara:strand:- start:1228 stop:1623 length:396 start_codon:yes stop_codon:yes gene_type:complete
MNRTAVACLLRKTKTGDTDLIEVLIVENEDGSKYYPHTIMQTEETTTEAATRAFFQACGLIIKSWDEIGSDKEYVFLSSETVKALPDKWRVTTGDQVTELVWLPLKETFAVRKEFVSAQSLLLEKGFTKKT